MDPALCRLDPNAMYHKNLWNMLGKVVDGKNGNNEIIYLEGHDPSKRVEKRQSYAKLQKDARAKSFLLRSGNFGRFRKRNGEINKIVVLHLDNYYESITWFWAVVAVGWIPCMSIPFKGNFEDHQKYINGLRTLLEEPLFITNSNLMPLFKQFERTNIKVLRVSQLERLRREPNQDHCFPGGNMTSEDIAMIMLTSGSTGNSKAVAIKHVQVYRSLEGKSKMHATTARDKFLNWTDVSHVANLMEIHLHALHLGAMQVQVQPSDIIHNPIKLLSLVDKYRISYTFAPNFLLNSIVKALQAARELDIVEDWVDRCASMDMTKVLNALTRRDRPEILPQSKSEDNITEGLANRDDTHPKWDLGCLRALISGGEANVVETCRKLTDMVQQFNAPASFIRPGFGMTETCAGCIYSTWCPGFDIKSGVEFASLGEPIINAEMRVMGASGEICEANEIGELQLNGLAIFEQYYNDPKATADAFTEDGWFRTGDMARIDELSQLHIEVRVKDTLVINGVNHYPHVIETALEDAKIEGMKPSFTAVFAHRPENASTDCMCIVYIPTYDHFNAKARIETLTEISKTVVLYTGIRPYKVIPLSERAVSKSVLGKLSRASIRATFERNGYEQFETEDNRLILAYQRSMFKPPSTKTEETIIKTYYHIFSTGVSDIGANCNLFNLGVSSSDLLKMRVELMHRLQLSFPITIFFAHPTIRELGAALDELDPKTQYDPIVVLQPKRKGMTKTPIFFIHPGMGEVLIFMNLARHITDRPVYALRARGFEGDEFFKDMDEVISCYHAAIKKTQPKGPYALAGYSFGSILTWEITKRMQAAGDEVKFLATFDQAPFLKERSRGYDWYECVISVSFFLGLMTEKNAYAELPHLRKGTRDQVLSHILAIAPQPRVRELGMTIFRLERWADLALAMKQITWEYDPTGLVQHMDIFWTVPLIGIVKAKTTEEWRDKYIGQWDRLVEKPVYHFVDGGHRTMINPPHLNAFQRLFKKVLEERGL